jgi:ferredoxin
MRGCKDSRKGARLPAPTRVSSDLSARGGTAGRAGEVRDQISRCILGPSTSSSRTSSASTWQALHPCRAPGCGALRRQWLGSGHHAGLAYLERDASASSTRDGIERAGAQHPVVGLAHSRGAGRAAPARSHRPLTPRAATTTTSSERLRSYASAWLARVGSRAKDRARSIVRRRAAARAVARRARRGSASLRRPPTCCTRRTDRGSSWARSARTRELEPTSAPTAGSCGTCTACIDACPTRAIREPGARRRQPLHQLTTRSRIAARSRTSCAQIGEWAFGCDVCSEVCPWGHHAPVLAGRFGRPTAAVSASDLVSWLEPRARHKPWSQWLEGSPLKAYRSRRARAQTPPIVLQATGARGELGVRDLCCAPCRSIPSALVREAAGWALVLGHGFARVVSPLRRAPATDAKRPLQGLERSLD